MIEFRGVYKQLGGEPILTPSLATLGIFALRAVLAAVSERVAGLDLSRQPFRSHLVVHGR